MATTRPQPAAADGKPSAVSLVKGHRFEVALKVVIQCEPRPSAHAERSYAVAVSETMPPRRAEHRSQPAARPMPDHDERASKPGRPFWVWVQQSAAGQPHPPGRGQTRQPAKDQRHPLHRREHRQVHWLATDQPDPGGRATLDHLGQQITAARPPPCDNPLMKIYGGVGGVGRLGCAAAPVDGDASARAGCGPDGADDQHRCARPAVPGSAICGSWPSTVSSLTSPTPPTTDEFGRGVSLGLDASHPKVKVLGLGASVATRPAAWPPSRKAPRCRNPPAGPRRTSRGRPTRPRLPHP